MSAPKQMNQIHAKYGNNPAAFAYDFVIRTADGPKPFGQVASPFQREMIQAVVPILLALSNGHPVTPRKAWIEGSKGTAKSTVLAICIAYLLAFSKVRQSIQLGAGDKRQASEPRAVLEDAIRHMPWLGIALTVERGYVRCAATGSDCEILSADAPTAHGSRPTLCMLDEATNSDEEFMQTVLDNASKSNAAVFMTMNAGFQGSWAWKMREYVATADDWRFLRWAEPAPQISQRELDEARVRNTPSRFARLYYGAWSSASGDCLDPTEITDCVDPSLYPLTAASHEFAGYSAGLDLAISRDHAALVIVAVENDSDRIRLAECKSWAPIPGVNGGRIDLQQVQDEVLNASRRYPGLLVNYDNYQAELFSAQLRTKGVRMQEVPFVGARWNEMASTLLQVFKSRRIKLFKHQKLIDSLGQLRIVEKSFGFKLDATRTESTGHADLGISLALALLDVGRSIGRGGELVMDISLSGKLWDNSHHGNPYYFGGYH